MARTVSAAASPVLGTSFQVNGTSAASQYQPSITSLGDVNGDNKEEFVAIWRDGRGGTGDAVYIKVSIMTARQSLMNLQSRRSELSKSQAMCLISGMGTLQLFIAQQTGQPNFRSTITLTSQTRLWKT